MTDNHLEDGDDDFDWHELNAWYKERHKAHVARNMEAYEKYIFQMVRLGFTEATVGAGHRFTHPNGLRIDFWKQSGKWTEVGTNKYTLGPKRMIQYVKAKLGGVTPSIVPHLRTGHAEASQQGTIGFRVHGTVTTPLTWPPDNRGTEWNTDPNTPPWEID